MLKAIGVRARFESNGSINKEGNKSSQKPLLAQCDNVGFIDFRYDNILFWRHDILSKKDPITGIEKQYAYPKISIDTIKHYMCREQNPPINPATLPNRDRIAMELSESGILRGSLDTANGGKVTRLKTTFYFEDARYEDVKNPPKIFFEVHSREGDKEENLFGEGAAANNFYYTEECSPNTWTATSKGVINLQELQFLSMSDIFDRRFLFEDDLKYISDFMLEHYGENLNIGYYKNKKQVINQCEKGIFLSDSTIEQIVKYNLSSLLNLTVLQKHDSLFTLNLEIKFIDENTCLDAFKNDDGWIPVNSDYINNLSISVKSKYVEVPVEIAEAIDKEVEEQKKSIIAANVKRKADKEQQKTDLATKKAAAKSKK